MIIENISQTEEVFFYFHNEGKSEFVSIEPGKYIFIDESNWTVDNVKTFVEHLREDENIRFIGNKKNYDIGTKHPTKEEFIDRFDLMDME